MHDDNDTAVDARLIGAGRAGGSLARALRAAGWTVDGPWTRVDTADPARLAAAGRDAGVVVLTVPDPAVAIVAAGIDPSDTAILHTAGSLGLDVLVSVPHAGSLHPLVALPDPETGAARLAGANFAVAASDDVAADAVGAIIDALGGRAFSVADEDRVAYHAAAAVAANHLVALMGQVERIAGTVGVPLEAYLDLARGALDNVAAVGPAAALTGPVARGDRATVARHLEAIEVSERDAYRALADAARRLVEENA